jgi:nickel superoxide dismutase
MRIKSLLKILPLKEAFAHCDIPCGIYDPHQAQLAAHTVIRMTQLLSEIKRDNPSTGSGQGETKAEHDIARMTHVKEEHSIIIEEELETLRNDYFKEEHFKQYPNLNGLFVKTLKLVGKARQNIDMMAAQEVLTGVQEIAEVFFKTKGVVPVRVKSIYPTGGEIVLHK